MRSVSEGRYFDSTEAVQATKHDVYYLHLLVKKTWFMNPISNYYIFTTLLLDGGLFRDSVMRLSVANASVKLRSHTV